LRGKAYALRRLGRFAESTAALKTLVSLDPLYAEILADLGYTLLRTGQYEEAKIMLNRAITLGAEKSFGYYTRADSMLVHGELEQAWQTIASSTVDSLHIQGFYIDIKLLVARAQANAERIDHVLDNYRVTDSQSLGPDFARALVYLDRGEQDKLDTLIVKMQESLQTAERQRPDAESTLLGFVQLYGLQKDQAKLAEAVKAYYVGVKPDALRIVENRSIPIAYAIAGDDDALLAHVDALVEQFGPWEFYYFTLDPSFNSMRDLPRFQAHDKRYRQWLEQNP
jgi:tetratricopeptide (TPR) repeat protein